MNLVASGLLAAFCFGVFNRLQPLNECADDITERTDSYLVGLLKGVPGTGVERNFHSASVTPGGQQNHGDQ